MGKGGYNGGSTIIRASIGYTSTRGASSKSTAPKRKKVKLEKVGRGFSRYLTLEDAQRAGLSIAAWQKLVNNDIRSIERNIIEIEERLRASQASLVTLRKELILAEGARQAAFSVVHATQAGGTSSKKIVTR